MNRSVKLFIAAKAFIEHQGKVLILQESKKYNEGTNTGSFDVPGGRMKPGEKLNEVLKREIKEETGLEVEIGKPFFVSEWRPVVKDEPWQVVAVFFKAKAINDKVAVSSDHDNHLWINPKDYKKYSLIQNLIPVFEAYLNGSK